jgi:hypothetical protein
VSASLVFDDTAAWPLGRFPLLEQTPGVAHAVTTRAGPDFGSVGTAARTAAAAGEAARAIGLDHSAWVHQVHGGTVLAVDAPGLAGDADALITGTAGLAVLGRSADCPLILLTGRDRADRPVVGFAHASWRATVRGLAATTVARLREDLGAVPRTLRAAIAPSAGPCCYEVGDEVRQAAHQRLGPGIAPCFLPHGERWIFDLWRANLGQLVAAGVPADRIAVARWCTICQGARFWSWRVQGQRAGRFAALIGVTSGR